MASTLRGSLQFVDQQSSFFLDCYVKLPLQSSLQKEMLFYISLLEKPYVELSYSPRV